MRRPTLLLLLALAGAPLAAAKTPAITSSAITWAGAEGRRVHGYMAIPKKARGRQPAVLVLADGASGGQAAAHALADAIARAGTLACVPRGDEPQADLRASLGWLRTNRYATGRVAVAALGPTAVARAIALAAAMPPAALLILDDAPTAGSATVPSLRLPPPAPGADLPPEAALFLKDHLR